MTEQELDDLLFFGSKPIIQTKQAEQIINQTKQSDFVEKWFHPYQPKQSFNPDCFPSLD